MSVSVNYTLEGSGWAKSEIDIDEHNATVIASYLSDALHDLISAINLLLKGADDATASFMDEPGEYRWRFSKSADGHLEVRILEFPLTFGNRADSEGMTIFQARCRFRTFAGAVLSAAQTVLKTHGLQGYREVWKNNDFPVSRMLELRDLLQQSC